MIEYVVFTSLEIAFVWAAMQEGNVLFPLRRLIDKCLSPLPVKVQLYARKPLYSCMFCMASLWGVIFSLPAITLTWGFIQFLFAVAGLNYILEIFLTTIINNEGEA